MRKEELGLSGYNVLATRHASMTAEFCISGTHVKATRGCLVNLKGRKADPGGSLASLTGHSEVRERLPKSSEAMEGIHTWSLYKYS